jgi:hypothetical protein
MDRRNVLQRSFALLLKKTVPSFLGTPSVSDRVSDRVMSVRISVRVNDRVSNKVSDKVSVRVMSVRVRVREPFFTTV